MRKKTPVLLVQPEDSFDQKVLQNLPHLSGRRLKRFLDEAHGLRRNIALRKKQQIAWMKKHEKDPS